MRAYRYKLEEKKPIENIAALILSNDTFKKKHLFGGKQICFFIILLI